MDVDTENYIDELRQKLRLKVSQAIESIDNFETNILTNCEYVKAEIDVSKLF